jgi:uncharacterized protein (TIGR03435 family)
MNTNKREWIEGCRWRNRMRIEELLALGVLGRGSRLGERIAMLLVRGREFSPRVSRRRVALGAAPMVGLAMVSSFAPRFFAFAQEPAQEPARVSFEVVSVKRSDSNSAQFKMGSQPGGRFFAENASVQMLIQTAWDVRDHQLAGAPGWLDSDKFTIEAKSAGAAAVPGGLAGVAQMQKMIQSLLADRFKLATHRETRQEPIYELVVAKGGSKLKPGEARAEGPRAGLRIGIGQVTGTAAAMPIFVNTLGQFLRRSVVDKTGLSGTYDFALKWTPEAGEFVPPGQEAVAAPADGPSIFTAVQEQLGLELKAARGPVEMLVIDHVEKPDAN